ncbi:MAG: hypothetical protein ACRDQD_14990 [Nocardioidaceae bacterium]
MICRVVVEGALGCQVLQDRRAVDVAQGGIRIDAFDAVLAMCHEMPWGLRRAAVRSHEREPTP